MCDSERLFGDGFLKSNVFENLQQKQITEEYVSIDKNVYVNDDSKGKVIM